jgi:hypothetical protein
MTNLELKTSINNLINKIDDQKVLKAYFTLLNTMVEEKDNILGHTAAGETLTKDLFVTKVKKASERVKSGKYTSQEDVEKQSQKW